jgi:6-phosphogluconolactonase
MNTQRRHVVVEPSAEKADAFAAELFRSIVCETVARRGSCAIALAGGTTPRSLYQRLARDPGAAVPWRAVDLFFSDERDVPHDHVESNYGMVQRVLLDHVPLEPQRIHPMPADADDLVAGAAAYEELIRRVAPAGPGGKPCLDLILLGMGADGHTASLFPNSDLINEDVRLVAAEFVPVLGRRRMTLTLPLINGAAVVMMLVTGEDKAQAVASVAADKPPRRDLPASLVDPAEGKLYIVLDAPAARLTYVQQ